VAASNWITLMRTRPVCQCEDPAMQSYDAVVLAGGSGRRLGGVDKAEIAIGSRPLLERALAAVATADRVVVVGPSRTTAAGLITVREEPPGGGPVAAVAAGLSEVESGVVVLLACDMPFVTAAVVQQLVAVVRGEAGREPPNTAADVAMLVDPAGRRQFLAGAYRVGPLRRALERLGSPAGASMRQLVDGLTVTEVTTDPEVTLDCDTWADVHHSRELLEGR
jgi:molybdopterin-guanine dinucleotide biosynthesis protein A